MITFSIPILTPHVAPWFYNLVEPDLTVKVTDFYDSQNVWLWRSVHLTAPALKPIERHIIQTFFAASLDDFCHE